MPLTRLWARPRPCQAEAGIARRLDRASPSLIHDGAAVWKMAGTDLRAVRSGTASNPGKNGGDTDQLPFLPPLHSLHSIAAFAPAYLLIRSVRSASRC
jgi:hypothetical protein